MSLYTPYSYGDELYHTGVLGMRWGIRRAHNKYGALTKSGEKQSEQLKQEYDKLSKISTLSPKGKERKSEVQKQYKKLTGKSINPPKVKKVDDTKKKQLDDMTDEELRNYNTRKQLENTYLSSQPKPKYPHGKSVSEMSNEELRVYNERKALESTYLGYQPKPQVSRGKQFVNTAISKVIAPAAIDAGKAFLTKEFKKQLGVKDTIKVSNPTAGGAKKKKSNDPTSDIVKALMNAKK